MARTIIIDEIKKDPDATPMSVDGVAKAWADANGTGTVSIDDSLNISSMDDDGTGDYSFNLTSAFNSTAYCPQSTGRSNNNPEGAWNTSASTPATTFCDVSFYTNSGGVQDQTALSWSALGDLA